MLGLTTESPDAEKVRKFIQDFQIDYRIGWVPAEAAAILMQGYQAIPQIFVISRDGFILERGVGYTPEYTSKIKQTLETALKERALWEGKTSNAEPSFAGLRRAGCPTLNVLIVLVSIRVNSWLQSADG